MFSSWILAATVLASTPVDFDTEVLPVLTRAGCNSGACHGAAVGRGGFKLSLFAGSPAADHTAIVHELEGRRVNLAKPGESLILAKPVGYLDHEGGALFDSDGEEAALIQRWIEEGAERRAVRKLDGLTVTPAESLLSGVNEELQLQVTAHFDDGTTRDATRWAVYSSTDPAAVTVDGSGKLRMLRRGRFALVVRYLTEMRTVQLTVPLAEHRVGTSQMPRTNWIDDEINESLSSLRIPLSPRADHAMLLRRIKLDLTGQLPTRKEWDDYVADTSDDKYEKLVDRLLESSEFTYYWTYRLSRWLKMPAYASGDAAAAETYFNWLRDQVGKDVGWNAMARELLLATGDSRAVGPANFHRQAADARGEAELVADTLLGVELRCANCHNHPLDRWTQDDYHGLAAIFSRLERNQIVTVRGHGEVTHPATGMAAVPRLPGTNFLAADVDQRENLARWLVADDNPYFATAFVNRVWKELMGRGLVEPLDGIRPTNPASHPRLLDRLAKDFATQGFRFRQVIRTVVLSEAYRRSSIASGNGEDDHFYSHALVKPLSLEVYVDAVSDLMAIPNLGGERVPAIRCFNPIARVPDVAALNGCLDPKRCVGAETLDGDLATRLQLINGDFLNAKLRNSESIVETLLDRVGKDDSFITELYIRALGREPSKNEQQYWVEQLGRNDVDKKDRLEDFCWSLLNCREFVTNH